MEQSDDEEGVSSVAEEATDLEISDRTLELIRRFTEADSPLTSVLREWWGLPANEHVAVGPYKCDLDSLAERLAAHLPGGQHLQLTSSSKRAGTRPTEETRNLREAAELIRDRRKTETRYRRLLEEVQLASSLDRSRAIRIGGYQAHYERFLGRLVAELHIDFPWIRTEVQLYTSRARENEKGEPVRGGLAHAFATGAIDYMLRPSESRVHIGGRGTVYSYQLHVVATEERLIPARAAQRSGGRFGFHIKALDGEVLLAAPKNYSSRIRIEGMMERHGVSPKKIIPIDNPLMLRVRALGGEGYAILSDEYSDIGGARERFPALLLDHQHDQARPYSVEMEMQKQAGLEGGVHAALDMVVSRLSSEDVRQPQLRYAASF
jgi:hypothetical protein